MSNIIVIAEVRAGSLKRPSLETITAAQQLASANGGQVIAIACGNGIDAAAAELGAANKVITIDGEGFTEYSGDAWAKAIAEQAPRLERGAEAMALVVELEAEIDRLRTESEQRRAAHRPQLVEDVGPEKQ